MYIESVKNRNSPPCLLLRESYREDGKVKKRTLANLTNWSKQAVSQLRVAMSGNACADFEIIRSLSHGNVAAVLACMKSLTLKSVIGGRQCREKDLVIAMIALRILDPGSKLSAARHLAPSTALSSLATELGLDEVNEDDLYAAMDWLLKRKSTIEKKLGSRHLEEGSTVLYDLTSVYMEGTSCLLTTFGHSRDGKKGKPQIEFGLLCDASGRPVAVRVFEGNVSDQKTVAEQVRLLRHEFGLSRVVIVGDRGMLTDARIREDLAGEDGLDWISALTTGGVRKLQADNLIQPELFDERDLAEISSPDFPDERLIVCRNPYLAKRRAEKREALLQATEKKLDEIKVATSRQKRRLKGADAIGIRVGRVLNRFKVAKHFTITITDECFQYERKVEKITEEAALDGIYVVRTSLDKKAGSADEIVDRYKSLSHVERAFRSLKTVDLHVRPVFHSLADRVRCHVFLCMLAYYVEWHMMNTLAPVLFKDEYPELGKRKRSCAAAPSELSDQALKKTQKRQTHEGLPIHSFRTLLADLGTIARNTVQFKVKHSLPIVKITIPTPLQRKALDLLGVRL